MNYKKVIFIFVAIIVSKACFLFVSASESSSEQTNIQEEQVSNIPNFSEFSWILKPSPLGGIGVFAAHDIPAGTLLFTKDDEMRILKVRDVPQEFIKYCVFISDEECLCPGRFDRMEIGWFMNHSAEPNIDYDSNSFKLYAVRDIKAGEEIFIDYNRLGEPEHLKEGYYKHS